MSKAAQYSIEPRGLSQGAAAAYVGVSVTSFVDLVAKGEMPVPIPLGGHLLWDRIAIDRCFDAASSNLRNMEDWRGFMAKVMDDNPVASGPAPQPATSPAQTGPKRRGPTIKTIHQVEIEEWATMSKEERDKVRKKTAVVFGREVRAEAMNRLERIALWELYRRRGEMIDAHAMRGITFRTHNRLKARGYVTTKDDEYDNVRSWQISAKGIEAIKNIPEEPPPQLRKA